MIKNLDESVQEELEMWRLIIEKVARLEELETYWSLDDVLRMSAVLDMQKTIESEMLKGVTKK